jgi:S1-C subfamily serine protease
VSTGPLIAGVFCGTPAAAAGMLGGDVLQAVGGHAVSSPASLRQLVLSRFHPGEVVSVTWVDAGGRRHTSSLRLVAGPAK